MPTRTTKRIWAAIGIILVGSVGWVGYRYYDNTEGEAKRYRVFEEKYVQGKLPILPGPYVSEGDPKDLKFELIDLGIGSGVEMSEDGDILYKWYGDKPIEKPFKDLDGFERIGLDLSAPIFRLRKKDGTFQSFPQASDVRLTPGGKVFEIIGKDSDFSIRYLDKEIYSHSSKDFASTEKKGVSYWSGQTKITDYGIFPNESSSPNMFFQADGTLKLVDRSHESYIYPAASSSDLGVLGIPFVSDIASKIVPRDRLVATTDKGSNEYPLPSELSHPAMAAGKSVAVLYNSLSHPSQVFQFKDKKFTPLPIVEGIVNANATSVNSKGEYILETLRNAPKAKGSIFPYIHQCIFVTGGKYYDLEKVVPTNGIQDHVVGDNLGYGPSRHVDENGNILLNACFDDFQHVLLLRRVK